jgi:hypothetical protein
MQRVRTLACSKPVEKWRISKQKPWRNDEEGDGGDKTEAKLVISGQVPERDDFEASAAPARGGAHRGVKHTITKCGIMKNWPRVRKNGRAAHEVVQ